MLRIGLALLLGSFLVGCASTGGREWLNSPLEERAVPTRFEVAEPVSTTEARPRLSHTVTLGETYADSAAPPRAAAPGAPSVQVNVPVTINHYAGYGYAGYANVGYGRSSPGALTSTTVVRSSPTTASPPVGGDWPAIHDYGPKALR